MLRAAYALVLAIAGALALPAAGAADAGERLALVIGQSAYRAVAPLPNPANDAKAVAEMLEQAGFEVTAAADLSQNELRASVGAFAARLAAKGPDTVALMFYAGHGIQVDGENYLIPVDVDPKRETDVPLQAVRLNDVLNTLAAVPSRMRLILLDACRNNPFPGINRTTGSGLAMVDARTGAAGTFISYSTSPGAEAEDGAGANSPYTAALIKVAREPGLSIEDAFKRVRVAVAQETDGRQVPWDSSSLTDGFNFFGTTTDAPRPRPEAAGQRSADDWRKVLAGKTPQAAYDIVLADDSVAAYEVFVALFAEAPQAPRVRSLLTRRQEMVAWHLAVLNNTATSYSAFLADHGASDLAATARRLAERARTRSLDADTAPRVAAAAPACPCAVPTPPVRKQRAAPRPRRAAAPPPIREADRRPPPPVYAPPLYPPAIGVGPIIAPFGVGPVGRSPVYHPPAGRRPVNPAGTRSGGGSLGQDAPIGHRGGPIDPR